jgi:phosphoglycerate dehydrogenase-like enzyme
MEPMKIYVAIDLPAVAINRLRKAAQGNELTLRPCETSEELAAHFDRKTEVLLTRILPDPATSPNLKWVQTCGAGIDHIVSHPLCKLPVRITTASGIHAESMSQLVFAFILYFQRSLRKIQNYQQLRKWVPLSDHYGFFERPSLLNQTLGIVGFGAIGQAVGRVGDAFGMRVLACRRHPSANFPLRFHTSTRRYPQPSKVYGPESVSELAALSDYLVLCLPFTTETYHLIDEDLFGIMKPSSILISVGRGGVVNEQALLAALTEGRIAGAALDVYEREPLPGDHPFYSMDNVLLSPHIGGASADYDIMVAEVFAENLTRYLSKQPLLNEVNWNLQY